jgi:predicted transcriptional regulator
VTATAIAAPDPAAYDEVMIEPAQIRAARALLNWKQTDLAEKSGVSEPTIKNIERGATDPRTSTLRAIQFALEAGGVVFMEAGQTPGGGAGVRLK